MRAKGPERLKVATGHGETGTHLDRASDRVEHKSEERERETRTAVGVAARSTATTYLSEGMVELDVFITSADATERDWFANIHVTEKARKAGFYVIEDARGVPVRNGKAWVVLINGAKSRSGFRALAKGTPLVTMKEHHQGRGAAERGRSLRAKGVQADAEEATEKGAEKQAAPFTKARGESMRSGRM